MGKVELQRPDFIINKNGNVINLLKVMSPEDIIRFVRRNPGIFPSYEMQSRIIALGFELQDKLLQHGGTIDTLKQEVHINGEGHSGNVPTGREIEPNLRDNLGYGFSKPSVNRVSEPIFFQIKNGTMVLFEREHNLLKSVLGDLYAKNRLPTPRISSTSLTNQNLMHIANIYGKGRIK